MNVSQYKIHDKLAEDAIASISLFTSIEEAITQAGRHPGCQPSEAGILDADPDEVERCVIGGLAFDYAVDDEGTAWIVRCESSASSIDIPSSIGGHAVSAIGGHAFSTCYSLEHVLIPEGITSIGKYAFMNTALVEVALPSTLRIIGDNAFYKCSKLTEVVLSDHLESIGSSAFRESALSALSIPASVSFIGQNAFKDTGIVCNGQDQTLFIDPQNNDYILEGGALYKRLDDGLVLIQVLDVNATAFSALPGTTRIAAKAFANLKRIERVVLPEGTHSIGEKAFSGCSSLASIELPDTLASIGKLAFQDTDLRELRIPASLAEAGTAAFYTGGSIARKHVPTIKVIEISPENTRFYIQDGILCHRNVRGGVTAMLYTGDAEHLVIPREVTTIGMYAFLNCSSIRSVEIHDGVSSIDVGGLDTGRSITSVVYVVYEGGGKPLQRFLINFPPGLAGREAAKLTFSRGEFSLPFAFASADDAILATQDTFLRAKAILERLDNPVMLGDSTRAAFKRQLARAVPGTVVAMGKNGFSQGVDMLYKAGVITQENIDDIIEEASKAHEIAVLSCLMELKRTAFQGRMFDFDL